MRADFVRWRTFRFTTTEVFTISPFKKDINVIVNNTSFRVLCCYYLFFNCSLIYLILDVVLNTVLLLQIFIDKDSLYYLFSELNYPSI
jgi:hypothetical protein